MEAATTNFGCLYQKSHVEFLTAMTDTSIIPADDPTGLYLPDCEIARRLGFGRKKWYELVKFLETKGIPNMRPYPRKDPLFGDKRYWPAVKQWHDDYHRVRGGGQPPALPSGEPRWQENFDEAPASH